MASILARVEDDESPLVGGKLNAVVRIGDTVRRPAGSWTATVHALLRHLRRRGFTLGPEPLGFDDQGREILSFMAGDTIGAAFPWPDWVWDEGLLADVGRAAARYHEAVADFRPAGLISWNWGPAQLGADQIVCHHDLAPYNVVVDAGHLGGIIDWDLIGPGTARSDLAFIAWQWVPLHDPFVTFAFGWQDLPDYGHRLRILLDSYGLADREGFIDDVIARIKLNRDVMVRRAKEGVVAYIRLVQEGHVIGMNRALSFVSEQRAALQAELNAPRA
jgi:hypothetical protein